MINKEAKTETWCKKSPPNTIKEYFTPIPLGLIAPGLICSTRHLIKRPASQLDESVEKKNSEEESFLEDSDDDLLATRNDIRCL